MNGRDHTDEHADGLQKLSLDKQEKCDMMLLIALHRQGESTFQHTVC